MPEPPGDQVGGIGTGFEDWRRCSGGLQIADQGGIVDQFTYRGQAVLADAEPGRAGKQSAGVGMQGIGEEVFGAGILDDAPGVHHAHNIGMLGDDTKVVGNQHDAKGTAALEFAQEVKDLGLHRDIKCSGWLIGKQQFWLAGECHGDHDPLSHAS